MVIRRSLFVLSCILSLVAVSLRAAGTPELEKLFDDANAKLDAGENQVALEMYNQILEAAPEADNVWIARAIAKWRVNDTSGAFADLAQVVRLNPNSFEAYNWRGRFRYEKKDYERCLADLNRALELAEEISREIGDSDEPADVQEKRYLVGQQAALLSLRGEVRVALDDRETAMRDLNRAVELNPSLASAFFLRALLQEDAKEFTPALADYSQVIKLTPENGKAWRNRGWLQFLQHEWDAAIADSEKALGITPNDAQAIRTIGYAQFAKAEYTTAAQTLAKAADAEPGPGSAYALLVRHHALSRSGDTDARLATAWETWDAAPWAQALAKFVLGQISEEELEKAAQETPDDGELIARACEMHFYIGLARKQAGDKSTARLRFKSTLGTDQKDFVEDALASIELTRL